MPHIVILKTWKELLAQMYEYSEQIEKELDAGTWADNPTKIIEAQALQNETESLCNQINAQFRADVDETIAEQEGMLGI